MKNKETNLVNSIRLQCSKNNVRLFRNGTGQAYQGTIVNNTNQKASYNQMAIILKNPRIVKYGLCEGSSDLIGWRSVKITPEMVGMTIAQFVALEVKTEKGTASEEQELFISNVLAAGGKACIARSVQEVQDFLKGEK